MRKYLRHLRNCQDISSPVDRRHSIQAVGDGHPEPGDRSRNAGSSCPTDRRLSFVTSAVGAARTSRVYRENWIECLVQLHRSIATGIAHDPRAVHDVVERLVRVPVNPQ
jgi:hypothetical protein